jgi:hypothetical protein
METFGVIGNEFINLYSKDNPILITGEICYFLLINQVDYHRPMICKGLIMTDKFTDGMNKVYFIKLLEILENPNDIAEFIYNKLFLIYPQSDDNELLTVKKMLIQHNFDFNKNFFKIEAFFVRKTEEKIIELCNEYISIIKKDLLKALKDIESI